MLVIHRAERADRLVAALADLLAEPAGDPFAPDLVTVHSRGIERWLAQELSLRLGASAAGGDGVCANVEFPSPGDVLGRILAATAGLDPRTDPWRPQRLAWPLLSLVHDRIEHEEWLAPLRAHLGAGADPADRNRRFASVRHIADLFDRYAVHRPAMLRAWRAGDDVDGAGGRIRADAAWQPQLWRALRQVVGVPSLAERFDDAAAALRDGFDVPDLPPRLSLFGFTALPASYVEVLAALAAHRDVHLYLLHPSPALWEAVRERVGGGGAGQRPREQDPTRDLVTHPLLASWGRDAREMQLVLAAADGQERHHPHHAEPRTLLEHLQAGVRADLAPPGPPAVEGGADARVVLHPADRSVQVHACHGRTRQVEVLRDAILHLLADDPGLEPRDIVVMCPDIETFAPIVQAVFGATVHTEGGLPDLRVRLADRALRQTNPVLRVVADVLSLADGRLTASDVVDLAGREPVRRRFAFDDGDLQRIEEWVARARIRWGLDGRHRAAFGLAGLEANTWRAGLDRLLLGVAMADEDDRIVAGAVPLDDVEGADVDLAGRLAELVDRLDEAVSLLTRAQPIDAWLEAIRCVAGLLTATDEWDRWQHAQLERILAEVGDEADGGGVDLDLAEVRGLLEGRLAGRPSRANHRTGDLTFCTLVPMRSVPHKVVCLLGLDDGAFPRRVVGDGDDLVERDPCVGDRDPRTEDRQLLLDALLAAEQHLVVTYTGRDERTNEPLPPAVPIGELLDCVDRTARTATAAPGGAQVHVEHPLQATDARNFTAGELGVPDGPFGFDPVALLGARAKAAGARPRPDFLDEPLPPVACDTIDLEDLVAFLQHPVKALLRQRLGIVLPGSGDEPSDAIPVELGGLERFAVGDRFLAARLAGADPERWKAAERGRGVLPPGALAEPDLADIDETVDALLAAARERCDLDAEGTSLDVGVALPDARRVIGTVAGVCGDTILSIAYSRVAAKHRLAAWVRLVAATAAHPGRPLRAVTVGRAPSSSSKLVRTACLPSLGATPDERRDRALAWLALLADLRDRGLRRPLPLVCKASLAYAEALRQDRDPIQAAEREWATTEPKYVKNEDREPEHRFVFGDAVPLEALLAEPPWDDEQGEGWAPDESSRFGRCARRLWDPILDLEAVEDL